ncbi:hypothetical protein LCGC14_3021260, partial [marine sediment metagenome]
MLESKYSTVKLYRGGEAKMPGPIHMRDRDPQFPKQALHFHYAGFDELQ